MIPRHSRHRSSILAIVVASLTATACEKVPLLAPSGSTITLTTPVTAISANGTATILAQVLESSGTPPHSGTRVLFTTNLGTIEPPEQSTDSSGRATVTFRANGASGIATIAASSGGASTSTPGTGTGTGTGTGGTTTTDHSLKIVVGTAAVGRIIVNANPSVLPTTGGVAAIVANVLDINGNALSAAPVTFTTTAGSLSASTVNTDASGNASVNLTTFQQATVTASVGIPTSTGTGGSGGTTGTTNTQGTVTITLTAAPTVTITPPASPPSAGLPSWYLIKVTPATGTAPGTGTGTGTTTGPTIAIKEVIVTWGDGLSSNLGAISGEQPVSHVYSRADTYVMSVTVTDVAGSTARVSTSVSVIPVGRPTIIVTPTPQSAPGGSTITFNVQITAPSGLAIQNVVIDFGDGVTQSFGGASGSIVTTHPYPAGVRTYVVRVQVTDSTGQTTEGTTIVSITT